MTIEEATGTSYKNYQFVQFQGESVHDRINNIQCKALTSQASSRTYRLIDKTNQSCGGTAIAIEIGDRYFFATAGHVISEDHKYEIVLKNKMLQPIDCFVSRQFDIDTDVGLLEIPKEKKHLIDSWVTDSDSDIYTDIDQHKKNKVVVVGYPGESAIRTPKEQISKNNFLEYQIWNALCYMSSTLPIEKWPTEGIENQTIEEQDIFIDFDPDGNMFTSPPNTVDISPADSMRCPKLSGISGGGIWLWESEEGLIWKPSVRLIGIQHRVFEKGQWMRGTLINCWLDLVAKKYPKN
jgi:hypothetical protein